MALGHDDDDDDEWPDDDDDDSGLALGQFDDADVTTGRVG